jgi:hypothetical protein
LDGIYILSEHFLVGHQFILSSHQFIFASTVPELFVMLDPSPVPLLTLVLMFTIILEQLSHCHWPLMILMSTCVCVPPSHYYFPALSLLCSLFASCTALTCDSQHSLLHIRSSHTGPHWSHTSTQLSNFTQTVHISRSDFCNYIL